ncbi:ATP-binding protein, partial [Streptococcus gordonii]|nr:ATP-binding protein [Streptococcus gordonii]
LDPKRIISQIELLRGQTITPTDTLIIYDEIQEAPRGITSLKYFNELAPEYHIMAAGSYMGLALRRENESFPVGKIDQLT